MGKIKKFLQICPSHLLLSLSLDQYSSRLGASGAVAMSVTSLPISLERVWFRSPRSLVTELRARARCASHPAHFGAQEFPFDRNGE